MKINKLNMAVAALAMLTLGACSDVDIPEATPVPTVNDLAYTAEGRNVTLNWQLPADGKDVSGVQIFQDAQLVATLEGAQTSYTVKRVETGRKVLFTVKAMYADGRVSNGITIPVTVEGSNTQVAFLMEYTSIDEIVDDDERAAAKWFEANRQDGVFLTPADIAEGVHPEDYACIWIGVDRQGIGLGWNRLPQSLRSSATVKALKAYMQEGGNLLLTNHATQLMVRLGRIDDRFAPGIFGDGDGGDGLDNWTINAQIGFGNANVYDHRSHAVFAGMKTAIGEEYFDHETFPMIGPGHREDHNCMWDLNAYGFDGNPDVVVAWEQETHSHVLATWGQVTDYCCAGMVEFDPWGSFKGRVIAIGLAAYEWNQNSGANIFQGNIEKLTDNCLNYLK